MQNNWQKSFIRKNPVVRHDNVNHHQDNTRDQMCEHFIGSQLVVMVLRAQWPLGTIAQFFHFLAEEKKTTKTKGILWLGYHRYPSN